MSVIKAGAWSAARRILASAGRVKDAMEKAVLQEAEFFRGKIVEGLREGAPGGQTFAPLAATTLAVRRFRGFKGTKPLIVRADLRNSIVVVKQGDGAVVGVLRSAKGRNGQPLVNIAQLNERGSRPVPIKLTPKARRFLHAAFRSAGIAGAAGDRTTRGVGVVQIPARPFLQPVFEKYGQPEDVSRRFLGRVATLLGEDFGR